MLFIYDHQAILLRGVKKSSEFCSIQMDPNRELKEFPIESFQRYFDFLHGYVRIEYPNLFSCRFQSRTRYHVYSSFLFLFREAPLKSSA